MATSNQKIRYDLEASVSGQQEVSELAGQLEGLANTLEGDLKTQALASAEALRELGAKQGAIDSFVILKQQVDEASEHLREAQSAAQQFGQTIAETGAPTRAQAGQMEKLRDAVRSAKDELLSKRIALEKARGDLRSLGIASTDVAQHQRSLRIAVNEAGDGLTALSQGIAQARGRMSEAARVHQAFTEDLRKLGLEGKQAPAGLEEAFRRLGMDGVKKAEAAVHELQVALAQIRNSPDVLPRDKAAAVAAFNQRVAELKSEARQAAGSAEHLGRASSGAGDAMGRAARQAAAWATALVGLNELKSLATHVIETGAAFENLEVRLANLLGGTEAAAGAMSMIKDLAAGTPYSVQDLAESFTKLTAFGLRPSEQQMRALADVASNLGGGTEALAGVTLALGQAWSKGKLQGEEMLQMAERGVPVWDALAAATGRTVPELQKMASAGNLGRDAIKALIDELGRMNAGASIELMSTFSGAVSNAKDALEEFFGMIADAGVLDWLTDKLRELLVEYERMKQTGELQEVAQDIADGFIAVARTAEAVTRTMIDMAPAIEAAMKVWLAFKAVNIVTTLYGIAAGAAVAAPGLVATAAGASSAAGGMSAAAGAATALGVALKRLLATTGVGVLLVAVGEIGLRLLGVGENAKKAAADIEDAFVPPSVNGPAVAADEASPKLASLADEAGRVSAGLEKMADTGEYSGDKLRQVFDEAIRSGKEADEALRGIGREFDLSTVPGIQNAAVVLDGLLRDGQITAAQFRDAWDAALKGVDLSTFELNARAALDGTWQGVGRLQDALDAGLREAIRRSGGDFDVLAGGMSKAAASAISDTDTIIAGLDRLQAQGVNVGHALQLSLNRGIQTADSQKAIDAIRDRIERVRDVLGDKVADGLLDQLAEQAEKAKKEIGGLQDALSKLGITSDADLKKAADQARNLYERVREGGGSVREQELAFQKMAEAAVRSGDSTAIAYAKSQAAVHGFEIAVDKAGKTVVRRMGEATKATQDYAGSINDATQEVQEHIGWLDRLQQRNAEVKSSMKMDGSGFAADEAGNRIVAGSDLSTLTGIAAFLKAAGVEDDDTARRIALEFSDGKGNIPYFSNPGQKKYGGDTMSMALLKAAERITFGGGSGSHAVGRTVRYDINLSNGKRYPLHLADEDSAKNFGAFLRELEDAKRSAGQ